MKTTPLLYTMQDAMIALQIGRTNITRLIRDGKLPAPYAILGGRKNTG